MVGTCRVLPRFNHFHLLGFCVLFDFVADDRPGAAGVWHTAAIDFVTMLLV